MSEEILRLGIDPSGAVTGVDRVMQALDRLIVLGGQTVSSLDRLSGTMHKTGDEGSKAAKTLAEHWRDFSTGFNQTLEGASKVLGAFKSLYDFGKQRAEIAETAQHFKTRVREMGADSATFVAAFRVATEHTVFDSQLMRSAHLAMAKGVSTDLNELSQLYMIAKAKSEEGFGGTIEVFDQLVQGISTGQARALKSLGFLTGSFGAAKDAVDVLLTREEALNMVLQQGAEDISLIARSGDSAADSFARFETLVDRVKNSLNNLLPVFTPVLESMSKYLGMAETILQRQGLLAAPNPFLGDTYANGLKQIEFSERNLKLLEAEAEATREKAEAAKQASTWTGGAYQPEAQHASTMQALAGLKTEISLRKEALSLIEKSFTSSVKGYAQEVAGLVQTNGLWKALTATRDTAAIQDYAKKNSEEALKKAKEEAKDLDELWKAEQESLSHSADWAYKMAQSMADIKLATGEIAINEEVAWKAMAGATASMTGMASQLAKSVPMSAELAKNYQQIRMTAGASDFAKDFLGESNFEAIKTFAANAMKQKSPVENFLAPLEQLVSDRGAVGSFASMFYRVMSSDDKQKPLKVSLEKTLSETFANALLDGAKSDDWLSSMKTGLAQAVAQAFSQKFPIQNAGGGINLGNLGTNLLAGAAVSFLTGPGGLFGSRIEKNKEAVTQAASINEQIKQALEQKRELVGLIGISDETASAITELQMYTASYSSSDSGNGIFSKKKRTYTLNSGAAEASLAQLKQLALEAARQSAERKYQTTVTGLTNPTASLDMQISDLKAALHRSNFDNPNIPTPTEAFPLLSELAQLQQTKKENERSAASNAFSFLLQNSLAWQQSTNGQTDQDFIDLKASSMNFGGARFSGSGTSLEAAAARMAKAQGEAQFSVNTQLAGGGLAKDVKIDGRGYLDILKSNLETIEEMMSFAEFATRQGTADDQKAALQRYSELTQEYFRQKQNIIELEKSDAEKTAQLTREATAAQQAAEAERLTFQAKWLSFTTANESLLSDKGNRDFLSSLIMEPNADTETGKKYLSQEAMLSRQSGNLSLASETARIKAGYDSSLQASYLADKLTAAQSEAAFFMDLMDRNYEIALNEANSYEVRMAGLERARTAQEKYNQKKLSILDTEAAQQEEIIRKQDENKARQDRFTQDLLVQLSTAVGEMSKQGGREVLILSQGQPRAKAIAQQVLDARQDLEPELRVALQNFINDTVDRRLATGR